jgi:rhomboid protease GluP
MSELASHPLETILKQCAALAPQPWYPQADGQGIPRERLDSSLDDLRLAGLIRLTDWVQGKGQGYALTPAGTEALRSPSVMARLRKGDVPVPRPAAQEEQLPERASLNFRRVDAIRQAIESHARPVVTLSLLYLNIAMFVVGCILSFQRLGSANPFLLGEQAAVGILHDTGLIDSADIFPGGQWWRLLVCFFVHIGFLHLLLNMVTLWVFGPLLEKLWGRWNFLAIYLVSGLCASLTMVAFGRGGAGASGALWGVVASLGMWFVLNRKALNPAAFRAQVRQLLFILIINIVFTVSVPNISVEGHFGGGLAGLLLAFPVDYARYHTGWRRYLAYAALPFLFLCYLSFFLQHYAAPHYPQLLGQTAYDANVLYSKGGLRALLNTEPQERRLAPETRAKIDESVQQLQAVNRLHWVGLFGNAPLREKVAVGNELVDGWIDLFERLSRSAEAPAEWTKSDEADLMVQRRHLIDLIRRWNELFNAPKKAGE